MATNKDDFAFARPAFDDGNGTLYNDESGGLTIREYFAAKAMQGLLANTTIIPGSMVSDASLAVMAAKSVQAADHLIRALNTEG